MCRSVCSQRGHFLHSSAFSRFAHSMPPDPKAAAMRQQGQALPEQLLLEEHGTQVWPQPQNKHSTGTGGLWHQHRLLQWGGTDSVTRKSFCCCCESLGQHRQPSLCLSMLRFVLEFQIPARLLHDCQSRAGASPSHDPPVPSEGQHSGFWERWCGGKSRAVVGRLPSTVSWEQPWPSRGRGTTPQPAEGAPGAAGSSRSGRRCWWLGPRGKH